MKIIILTAKYGMGHISASNSIKQNILEANKGAEVEVIDLYEYSMPVLSKYMYSGFSLILKFASKTYSNYYKFCDRETENVDLITRKLALSVEELIEVERPDMIVSTFPVISKAVSLYKDQKNSNMPLITCITDVTSHSEWIAKNTDKYMVPCEDVKYELIRKGIRADRIVVYGIPVSYKFRELYLGELELEQIEKSKIVSISKYRKTKELLIMGGGLGILPTGKEFYEKINSVKDLHTTIVTGNNKKLYDFLYGKFENITVLGYSNNVSELMHRADCVVSKPGGITLFEAIYSLTPMVSFNTILPNEIKNIDFLQDNNFGISLNEEAEESVERIIKFVNDTDRIESMKKSMRHFVSNLDNSYFEGFVEDIQLVNQISNGNSAIISIQNM